VSGLTYADASAIVKLVVEEPESRAMNRWFVESTRVLTSRVGLIETVRASARRDHDPAHREQVIRDVEVIELNPAISIAAASLQPVVLRCAGARAAGGPAGLTKGLGGVGVAPVVGHVFG